MGGGGTRLHVLETGNRNAAISSSTAFHCALCWGRQLNSDLAADHRLFAMDLVVTDSRTSRVTPTQIRS